MVLVVLFSVLAVVLYRYGRVGLQKSTGSVVEKQGQDHGTAGQIRDLKDDVSRLERQIEAFWGSTDKMPCGTDQLRVKWKTWIVLLNKMESGEEFAEELGKFCKVFYCDRELIDLVKKLSDTIKVKEVKEGKKYWKIYQKVMSWFVQCKKVDLKDVLAISGYVLSSCDCEMEE
jgi:hypothetical protein